MSNTGNTFAGSMPEFYERHMVPMHFDAHARIMAARLGGMRSGRVLEIAAGTGALTRLLVRDLPCTVRITATDLNQPMLDQARLQPGAERVHWQREDASSLSFPDGSFDAVLCQFGVMFFPDKLRAFREAFRVLKPGGRFVFKLWDRIDRNPLPQSFDRTVSSLFPDDPPRSNRVPFGYHDPAVVRRDLAAVGFVGVDLEQVSAFSQTPSARAMAVAYVQGGVLRNEIEAQGPEWLEQVTEAVSNSLVASFGDGPMKVPNQALLVTAYKPSA